MIVDLVADFEQQSTHLLQMVMVFVVVVMVVVMMAATAGVVDYVYVF